MTLNLNLAGAQVSWRPRSNPNPNPGFLATSFEKSVSSKFLALKTGKGIPTMQWIVVLDGRGTKDPQYRCMHASFVLKSHLDQEREFLFSPYSVFQVIATAWSTRRSKPHTVVRQECVSQTYTVYVSKDYSHNSAKQKPRRCACRVYECTMRESCHLFIKPSVHPSIHPSYHQPASQPASQPSIHTYIHPTIHPSIHSTHSHPEGVTMF